MKRLLTTAILFAAAALAADVTGTWTGPMEMKQGGETKPDTAHLVLTQTGTEIKGTVGPNAEKQMPITKGSISESEVVLEAAIPNRDLKLVLRLKLEGEKLSGELRSEGAESEGMSGTMSLSRQN